MFAKHLFASLIVVKPSQNKYSYGDSNNYDGSPRFVRVA
jgi:hypothetical protein